MRVFVFILPISKNSIFYHFYFPSWSRTSLLNCFILVLSLFHVLWRLFYEFVLTFKFSFIFSMSRSKLVWISSTWMFSCFNLSFDCSRTLKSCMAREVTLQFWIFLSHAPWTAYLSDSIICKPTYHPLILREEGLLLEITALKFIVIIIIYNGQSFSINSNSVTL